MGKLCPNSKIEDIILELYRRPLNTNDLKTLGYSGSAITTAVRWLRFHRLIDVEIIDGSPKIVLNDRGKKVAELIAKIYEVLDS